jgi:hypothetical protein
MILKLYDKKEITHLVYGLKMHHYMELIKIEEL